MAGDGGPDEPDEVATDDTGPVVEVHAQVAAASGGPAPQDED